MPSWYDITSLSDRAGQPCTGIDESKAVVNQLIAEELDGLTFGAEAPTPPTAVLKRRGLIAGTSGEPVLVEWVPDSEVKDWAEKRKPKADEFLATK